MIRILCFARQRLVDVEVISRKKMKRCTKMWHCKLASRLQQQMTVRLLPPTEAQPPKELRSHFDNPDENLQLVDVELQVHSVGQPRSQQVHGAGVPLLWWTHKKETHKSISAQRELSGSKVP